MSLLLPLRCLGCGDGVADPGGEAVPVCSSCRLRLSPLPAPRCPRCDLPRGTGAERPRECARCGEWPPVLAAARSATALTGPAEALVRALKYGGWRRLAPELSRRMARVPLPPLPLGPATAVVPVPTLPSRIRRRGYNQAFLLAEGIARAKGLPLLKAVRRISGVASQVSLPLEERATNVEASFETVSGGGWRGTHRHVILVDDVLTTGATAAAVARVLASAGVEAVTALTFARALPRSVDGVPE